MKIDSCARCGGPMATGVAACSVCGWVPIGAGLAAAPKPRRKRPAIDPSRGSLYMAAMVLAGLLFWAHQTQAAGWAVSGAIETKESLAKLSTTGKGAALAPHKVARAAANGSGLRAQAKTAQRMMEEGD